ncbi:MAG: hypothetical protein DMF64_11430 [Acidobacteria bacterium]|nr:MAG: hypothetical protein DMF64_11430 [Acidobacteriota bacterium]
MPQHQPSIFDIWCPLCKKQVKLLRVSHAARLVDVSSRTIYRYIDEGLIYSVKVVGKTYRVCADCLFRQSNSE